MCRLRFVSARANDVCRQQHLDSVLRAVLTFVASVLQFVHSLAGCPALSCRPLVPPAHSQLVFGHSWVGAVREFSCSRGYVLSGSNATTCLPDRTWANWTGSCSLVQTLQFSPFPSLLPGAFASVNVSVAQLPSLPFFLVFRSDPTISFQPDALQFSPTSPSSQLVTITASAHAAQGRHVVLLNVTGAGAVAVQQPPVAFV